MYKIEQHPILDISERKTVDFVFKGQRVKDNNGWGRWRYFYCFFVFVLFLPLSVKGQTGFLDTYSALKGNRIISRVSSNGQYRMTCYHTNHNIANFVVTDGSVCYNYPSSNYVPNTPFSPNPVLNSGYIIRDMKIKGDTCWICGSYWRDTGEWIFNIQGQAYMEVLYNGFVGYLLMSAMTQQGSCPIWYITVPGTQYLNKMVLTPQGIAAIGEYGSDRRFFVELTRNSSSLWSYKVGESSYSEEVFRDITYAGGKIVVLSRFDNPQHYMYYTNGLGLRYGTPGSFISTGQHLYCYFTSYITGISDLDFDPEEPIIFDKTYVGEGVAVGYICNPLAPVSSYRGRLVFFIVDAENDHYPECVVSNNNQKYETVIDISSIDQNRRAVLLRDSLGNSVYRFSQFQNCTFEKILSLTGPQKMSVSSFASPYNDMGFFSGGHFASMQNKISCLYEPQILSRINSWNANNCSEKIIGGSSKITSNHMGFYIDEAIEMIYSDTVMVNVVKLYPSGVSATRNCTDVN